MEKGVPFFGFPQSPKSLQFYNLTDLKEYVAFYFYGTGSLGLTC